MKYEIEYSIDYEFLLANKHSHCEFPPIMPITNEPECMKVVKIDGLITNN